MKKFWADNRRSIWAGAKCIGVMGLYWIVCDAVEDGIYDGSLSRRDGVAFLLCLTAAAFFMAVILLFKPYRK